jgi:hypothetical protein
MEKSENPPTGEQHIRGLFVDLDLPIVTGQSMACAHLISQLLPALVKSGAIAADQAREMVKNASSMVRLDLQRLANSPSPRAYDADEIQRYADAALSTWEAP